MPFRASRNELLPLLSPIITNRECNTGKDKESFTRDLRHVREKSYLLWN
jgi:hypothetical protein